MSDALYVMSGYDHSGACTSASHVYDWGRNNFGQLGIGTTTDSVSDVPVTSLPGMADAAAGWNFTMGQADDDRVYSWGRNNDGELGDGTTANRSSPVKTVGLP